MQGRVHPFFVPHDHGRGDCRDNTLGANPPSAPLPRMAVTFDFPGWSNQPWLAVDVLFEIIDHLSVPDVWRSRQVYNPALGKKDTPILSTGQ